MPLADRALYALEQLRGAGDEAALARVEQRSYADMATWLAAIADLVRGHSVSPAPPPADVRTPSVAPAQPMQPAVHAILLLLPPSLH